MSLSPWLAFALTPAAWVVACLVCFLWFTIKDKRQARNSFIIFRQQWPFIKVLIVTQIGGVIGFYVGFLISQTMGFFMFSLGTLPGAYYANWVLTQMRPNTKIWRIFSGGVTVAITAVFFVALSSVK